MNIHQIPSRIVFFVQDLFVTALDIQPPPDDLPPPNTRILERLRLCRMKMRKKGILAIGGYTPPPRGESVQVLWSKHGWLPPKEGMKLEPAKVEPETYPPRREIITLKSMRGQ